MKTTVTLLSFAAVIMFFTACSNPRYINSPSIHNAAFLRQRGDMKFTGAFAANPNDLFEKIDSNDVSKNLGFDVQAAFAVTDHFLIQAGGMYRSEKDHFNDDDLMSTNNQSQVNYTRSMFDVGAGYYTALSASGKAYFNGVLGLGFGTARSEDFGQSVERRYFHDFNFIKYYAAPSFNFFFSENARLSFAPRFSLMTFNNIKTSYLPENEDELGYSSIRNKGKVFFEPSLLFEGGFPNMSWMKFDVGVNFASNPLSSSKNSDGAPTVHEDYTVRSRNFLLSLGLSFYPFDAKYR